MNRAGRPLRWASGTLTSALAVIAGLSLRDLAGAVAVVLIVVVALCWVIKDSARTRRLAMLVRAWRDPSSRAKPPSARLTATPAKRPRSQVDAADSVPAMPAGEVSPAE